MKNINLFLDANDVIFLYFLTLGLGKNDFLAHALQKTKQVIFKRSEKLEKYNLLERQGNRYVATDLTFAVIRKAIVHTNISFFDEHSKKLLINIESKAESVSTTWETNT